MLAAGGEVRVVLITAGDGYVEAVVHETGSPQPRPSAFIAYGEQRLRESRAAVRVLAADRVRLADPRLSDGGLDGLLQAHWWRTSPERSRTTGATDPPYDDAGARARRAYDGDDLRRELERIVRETRPTMVVLPDPLDRHPDHRAAGLFTLLALYGLGAEPAESDMPQLLAYLVHWPDWPPGWNATPPHVARRRAARCCRRRRPRRAASASRWRSPTTRSPPSRRALQRYATQLAVMAPFLTAFLRRTEPLHRAPPPEIGRVAEEIERRVEPLPPSVRRRMAAVSTRGIARRPPSRGGLAGAPPRAAAARGQSAGRARRLSRHHHRRDDSGQQPGRRPPRLRAPAARRAGTAGSRPT